MHLEQLLKPVQKITLMRLSLTILALFTFAGSLLANSSQLRTIEISFNDLKNTEVYLGFHLGKKKYISDTLMTDAKGKLHFKTDYINYPGGIYFLVLPENKLFEILFTQENEIKIKTDTAHIIEKTNIIQSPENKYYYEYLKYMEDYNERISGLYSKIEENNNRDKIREIEQEMLDALEEMKQFQNAILKESEGTFFHTVIDAQNSPQPRTQNENESESDYFEYQYNFFQNHFFDYVDFSDHRLVRTPVLEQKIDKYINKYTRKHPDSIKYAAERVVELSKKDTLTFRFVLTKLFTESYYSKYTGMEAVFVYLADQYYYTDQAYWVDPAQLARIKNRADNLRENLIGLKAKELVLKTADGKYTSLYKNRSRHNVLVFWDPDCEICKKNVQMLREITMNYDIGFVSIFAVYDGIKPSEWKNYISEYNFKNWIHVHDPEMESNYKHKYDVHSTPLFYYLDENMIIRAKKIGPNDVKRILEGQINW